MLSKEYMNKIASGEPWILVSGWPYKVASESDYWLCTCDVELNIEIHTDALCTVYNLSFS